MNEDVISAFVSKLIIFQHVASYNSDRNKTPSIINYEFRKILLLYRNLGATTRNRSLLLLLNFQIPAFYVSAHLKPYMVCQKAASC